MAVSKFFIFVALFTLLLFVSSCFSAAARLGSSDSEILDTIGAAEEPGFVKSNYERLASRCQKDEDCYGNYPHCYLNVCQNCDIGDNWDGTKCVKCDVGEYFDKDEKKCKELNDKQKLALGVILALAIGIPLLIIIGICCCCCCCAGCAGHKYRQRRNQ